MFSDDEDEGDDEQVGRHHRDVDEGHRLDEQEPHAGPLEHGLGHQREGDQVADLQAGDGDDRHQAVPQRVAEMDRAVGQPARAGEADEIGAQHLQHLGAHQPHHQRDLEQRERDRRAAPARRGPTA